ncbi:hypothetical protein [Cohnella sp. GCM10012308]|uniref:hypothetical protein n=1 Tax=Cohnella sp. GCM10012308 TaxID=3317329 RepID=UPI003607AF03
MSRNESANARVALLRLEWQAYRTYLPRDAASWSYWALILAALLVAAVLFLGDRFTIETVFALGASLSFLIALYAGGGMALTLWENGFREWWLCLPVSRRELARAKVVAACGMQYVTAGGVWLVCCLFGLVRLAGQDDTAAMISGGGLVTTAISYGLLSAAIVPLGVTAGYCLAGMNYGWRRWLLIPWLALFIAPFILFALIYGADTADYLDAGSAAIYACLAALLATGAYRVCLALNSKYGMADLARHRPGGTVMSDKRARRTKAIGAGRIGTGFSAVYALERSRYRYWGAIKSVRVIYASLLAAAGGGGYFGAGNPHQTMDMLRTMLVIPCILPVVVLTVMMSHEANKRRLEWWLGLPYSRTRLLIARFAAVWAFTLRYVGGLLAALSAGMALNGREAASYFSEGDRIWIPVYLLGAYALCGMLVSALSFTQIYSMRSTLTGWLFMPLWLGCYFLPGTIPRWAVPDELLATRVGTDYWIGLAAAAALALAVVPLCFRSGAKWMHLYLFNTTENRQRKRGEQAFKFRS